MPPKIEILYFAGCPNYEPAMGLVREALRAAGVAATVELVAVETEAEAVRHGFYGSPTVRIDGRDVVPPPSGATPTLACRMYRADDGRLSPVPPAAAVTAAVTAAASPTPAAAEPGPEDEAPAGGDGDRRDGSTL